jgi:TolA-binding protein
MAARKKIFLKKVLPGFIGLCLTLGLSATLHAGGYAVHVSSYKTIGQTGADLQAIRAQGWRAFVAPASVAGGQKWHRVYAGSFASRKEAFQAAGKMQEQKLIDKIFVHYLPGAPKARLEKATAKISAAPTNEPKDRRPPAKKREEAFRALMMGDRKLMPKPPAGNDKAPPREKVFADPEENDFSETHPRSDMYNQALALMAEKNYARALATFKEFVSQNDTDKEWGQKALRRMADCHYRLGKAGSRQDLLIAVEFYKNTLENFPDPRKENALTYYRLAKTHEALQSPAEAGAHYQNLITRYSDSPYAPEAHFRIGEIHYREGRYAPAAEALIRYQLKYRSGAQSKQSFYMIAHSFFKTGRSADAEVWFREAQKKWPDLSGLPGELLIDAGSHKTALGRFDEAAHFYSWYVNLYPADEKTKDVLLKLADAYRQAGQGIPALAVYGRLIDRYPGTRQADESMLAMAKLGMEKPERKVFRFAGHLDFYRQPLETCDQLLARHPTGEIAEEALLQKAEILIKKNEKRKAADVYLEYLRRFPAGRKTAAAARGLKTTSTALIDESFAKKDYLAVAYVYFKAYGAVTLGADEYPQVDKIAQSLQTLGFIGDSVDILRRYLPNAAREDVTVKVSLDLARGRILQGNYDEAGHLLAELARRPSVQKSALLAQVRQLEADMAYRRGQYEQAVQNYDALVRSGQTVADPGRVHVNYARALREQRQTAESLKQFLAAVGYLGGEKIEAALAYKEIGDLYLKNDNPAGGLHMYAQALAATPDPELKRWSLFLMGQAYLKMNRDEQAQNIFARLKTEDGAGGFWSQVADFSLADHEWWNKYGELMLR